MAPFPVVPNLANPAQDFNPPIVCSLADFEQFIDTGEHVAASTSPGSADAKQDGDGFRGPGSHPAGDVDSNLREPLEPAKARAVGVESGKRESSRPEAKADGLDGAGLYERWRGGLGRMSSTMWDLNGLVEISAEDFERMMRRQVRCNSMFSLR